MVTEENSFAYVILRDPLILNLTALPEKLKVLVNIHLDALEHNNTIAFMHAVQDGAAVKLWSCCCSSSWCAPTVIKLAKQNYIS